MIRNKVKKFAPFESPEWSLVQKQESELNRKTRDFFLQSVNGKLNRVKNPKIDLKSQYQKIVKASFVVTLAFLIISVQIARMISIAIEHAQTVDVKIEVADIPPTQQFKRPSPPPKPSIPIPTEEESIPEDLTIASTELDLSDIPPSPAPPDEELPIFVAYDEPPKIIGGLAALGKFLKYPPLAQRAGVEGIVFVKVLVGLNGKTEKTKVIKAKPANFGFEESAVEVFKKVKWIPAKQRDKSVRVWVTIPVQFQLVNS